MALSPAAGWPAAAAGPARSSCSPHEFRRLVALASSKAASDASSSVFRLPGLTLSPSRRSLAGASLRSWLIRAYPSGGFWEEPDDGYGSEFEEMNGEEDEDEEQGDKAAGEVARVNSEKAAYASTDYASEYERLRHEVDLLLNPEEKAILEQNKFPDLSIISCNKWRPFHTRALSGQIPFMGVLLQNGLDIDAIDKDGLTTLHRAVIGKKEAVISHLLRRGANPHVRDRDGATPLHHAVQVGAMQTVKLLIKYKVDVNVADNEGWTPLHLAIQGRSRDIAKVLLVNGADKNRRNKDGKTPLDLSLCYGKDFKSYELAKLLKLVPANREL
ncbi:unnamed protein product [Spirodela intermedia]|uniref:Uncharacterized protein n=1 Tax=Spirodela intermedia TaxID=51605 RepID=A0A7I8LIY6_SPIIN|nr:unnamed protein product [Spirodela intermedia]